MPRSPVFKLVVNLPCSFEEEGTLASMSATTARMSGTSAVTAAVRVVESAVSNYLRIGFLSFE